MTSEVATITFINDAGRSYRLPFQSSQSWPQMEVQISDACRRPLNNLRSHQYELVGPEGEIILPRTWELTIQPGWTIFIVFTDAHQQTSANEHRAQHSDIMQRLDQWEAQQEINICRWEAERQRERERWEEERRVDRTRWEDERQRERDGWEEEREAERHRWEDDRRRERDRWEDEHRTEQGQRLGEIGSIHRVWRRPDPKHMCGISPCLCWLSGNRGRCHVR